MARAVAPVLVEQDLLEESLVVESLLEQHFAWTPDSKGPVAAVASQHTRPHSGQTKSCDVTDERTPAVTALLRLQADPVQGLRKSSSGQSLKAGGRGRRLPGVHRRSRGEGRADCLPKPCTVMLDRREVQNHLTSRHRVKRLRAVGPTALVPSSTPVSVKLRSRKQALLVRDFVECAVSSKQECAKERKTELGSLDCESCESDICQRPQIAYADPSVPSQEPGRLIDFAGLTIEYHNLISHCKARHDEESRVRANVSLSVFCISCSCELPCQLYFGAHLQSCLSSQPQFVCPFCDVVVSQFPTPPIVHITSHLLPKNNICHCDLCSESFFSSTNRRYHSLYSHGAKRQITLHGTIADDDLVHKAIELEAGFNATDTPIITHKSKCKKDKISSNSLLGLKVNIPRSELPNIVRTNHIEPRMGGLESTQIDLNSVLPADLFKRFTEDAAFDLPSYSDKNCRWVVDDLPL